MRTPGEDIELALGLMFAEGIARALDDVRLMRISAESGETAPEITIDASIVDSNQVDIHLARAPRRKPERSMLASSACGVCGAVLIEDLRRDLADLPSVQVATPALLSGLVERLRSGKGALRRLVGVA